jgi:hypothetical protein
MIQRREDILPCFDLPEPLFRDVISAEGVVGAVEALHLLRGAPQGVLQQFSVV